jgi:hypothetical protein
VRGKDKGWVRRPGKSVIAAADTTAVSAGNRGRVWAINLNVVGATAAPLWNIRTGSISGTILWVMMCPDIASRSAQVEFPKGLAFTNGLFLDEVQGNGAISICYSVDTGGDV